MKLLWRAQGRARRRAKRRYDGGITRQRARVWKLRLGGRDFEDALAELQDNLESVPDSIPVRPPPPRWARRVCRKSSSRAFAHVLNNHGIALESALRRA